MHKDFYASGFLYHSPTEKILLQQTPSGKDFTLFSIKCSVHENPAHAFQKIISHELGVTIPLSSITLIYDYIPENTEGKQSVFYADISDVEIDDDISQKKKAAWFTQRQISKLKLQKQTDHDITIGQRVIRANKPNS